MAFRPSTTTQQFLAAMNQNHCLLSQFTWANLLTICPTAGKCTEVYQDLLTMNFMLMGNPISTSSCKEQKSNSNIKDIEEEVININRIAYDLSLYSQWCKKNRKTIEGDEEHDALLNNLRVFASIFRLIPAPHWCPPPPSLCMHLHQEDMLPCSHLHTEDITTPPCLLPHQSNDDVPMELAAPTHSFSEAALQTPAPIHKVDMPPPPPIIPAAVTTSPAAVSSIPKPGPKPRPSYASAAAKPLNPAAPSFAHAPPCAPGAPQAQTPKVPLSTHLKKPYYATQGPSHQQFFIEAPSIPCDTSLPSLVSTANKALMCTKSTLKVDSASFSPHGITCATVTVPSTSDLDIIKAIISGRLLGVQWWTCSVQVPFDMLCLHQHVQNEPVDTLGALSFLQVSAGYCIHFSIDSLVLRTVRTIIIPSMSFIKITDIPFLRPSTTDPIPSSEVDDQLQHSIIPLEYIVHWCYIHNSPKADSATIWINLSDLQKGTCTSQLISHCLFINRVEVLIKGAKAHTTIHCPICMGPHLEANHCSIVGCCCSNPKASPPIPPTPTGKPLLNMLQTTSAALTGTTVSTRPGSRTGPSRIPQHKKASHFPLPPHAALAQHPATDATNPTLPIIHEDNERDDDDMEPFGLELDDDYAFWE
ncbi:hypothetical protein P691DRAFT_781684 [Macrolepiota fuliginosa MF-IS2]|uniref:Uncharacterized protein n=1 Tax=Macrolepiota fuliginosa MF-IS2 TaxID=1400762 RepID=A0A9P5WZM7_9AGAR|nr:hypothetical protein P691DRAFT_781684 [Macrolepiota fuliginosa MF-IS2]